VQSGASVKCTVGDVGETVEVDGVLRGQRWRRALGEAVEVNGVLWAKRSRSTACSGAGGGGVLRAKRSRVKRSSGIECEAVEATTCFGCWQRQRPNAREWQKFAKCGASRACT
jgi:hypothetical protein